MNAAIDMNKQLTGFAMQAKDIAAMIGAKHYGNNASISGVSTDTRTIKHGQLFVALKGPNFDAHDFIEQAMQKGAVCCLVEKQNATDCALVVDDALQALGKIASGWRAKFTKPIVAVTGSNGKTTVKEMLATILSHQGQVLATQGNLNNDIGLPLTLLRLDAKHDFAVIEMGANHAGEIAYLTEIGQPDVAIITNAGPAHLEGFGSIDGVAKAKGEIFSGLKRDGVAIINADDNYATFWKELANDKRIITFGLQSDADVSATYQVETDSRMLAVSTPAGKIEIALQLLGQHNVMNALAAIAAAIAINVPLTAIKAGLEAVKPVAGRLQLKQGIAGSRIIDDTYNANPLSLQAALDVLSVFPGKHFLVLGDMGELGEDAERLHAEAGEQARRTGVERLYTLGELAKKAASTFGENAQNFSQYGELIAVLNKELDRDVTLVVKGSRLMHLEKVVMAVTQANGEQI